jgi:hypothetical protein
MFQSENPLGSDLDVEIVFGSDPGKPVRPLSGFLRQFEQEQCRTGSLGSNNDTNVADGR